MWILNGKMLSKIEIGTMRFAKLAIIWANQFVVLNDAQSCKF
jgi:hypothetical protein